MKKIVFIKPKLVSANELPKLKYPIFPMEKPKPDKSDRFIGKYFVSNNCGRYRVLEKQKRLYGNSFYKIQFIKTGYIKQNVTRNSIRNGTIKDPYFQSVKGIGFMGEYKIQNQLDRDLYHIWAKMIARCFDNNHPAYKYYKKKGITVHRDWLSFTNFRKDIEKIPNWSKKKRHPERYEIDKDYFGSNIYSKDTVVWLSKEDNVLYRNSRAFEVISSKGKKEIEISISSAAKKYNLNKQVIVRCLRNKIPEYKGCRFRYLENGEQYRYEL